MGDLIAGLPGYFLRNSSHGLELRIKDLAAFGANDMGVRVGFIAIVTAAFAGNSNFEDLPHALEQAQSLIDRGLTGGGVVGSDLFINLLGAGVPCALGEDPQHGQALGSKPAPFIPQHLDHSFQSPLRVSQNSS